MISLTGFTICAAITVAFLVAGGFLIARRKLGLGMIVLAAAVFFGGLGTEVGIVIGVLLLPARVFILAYWACLLLLVAGIVLAFGEKLVSGIGGAWSARRERRAENANGSGSSRASS